MNLKGPNIHDFFLAWRSFSMDDLFPLLDTVYNVSWASICVYPKEESRKGRLHVRVGSAET